jgi:NAD(P)H-hydrate epimerase
MTLSFGVPEDLASLDLGGRADAIVIGPGLAESAENARLIERALDYNVPMVIDAGALRLLHRTLRGPLGEHRVLTPHPGEAAAILGISTECVESDRFAAVEKLSEITGATVILKGSRTLVRTPRGPTYAVAMGSSSLSVAGSGDVLAGLLSALLARRQGPNFHERAALAVSLHALAGERFERESGDSGLLASELPEWILRVKNDVLSSARHSDSTF